MQQKSSIFLTKSSSEYRGLRLIVILTCLFLFVPFLYQLLPHSSAPTQDVKKKTTSAPTISHSLIFPSEKNNSVIPSLNVTLFKTQPITIPKSKATPVTENKVEWKKIITKSGDTLTKIFYQLGIKKENLTTLLNKNNYKNYFTHLRPNQIIEFRIKNNNIEQIILPYTATQLLTLSREKGVFKAKIIMRQLETKNAYLSAIVKGSLYTTAKRHGIPFNLIHKMIEIFTWDIDFSKDIHDGDQITLLYQTFYADGKLVKTGDILAITYTNKKKQFAAIRHTHSSGKTEYYTPQGMSLKKAFIRYPIRFSHISSTFNMARHHPILHYKRPHKGIDLAAPIGTPIHATGDGIIALIGRQNGYGNMVKINHSQGFSSIYGHMLKFQKGLAKGARVKKGDIIGYVGQTGLATGPHCHYEFHANKQPQNPLTFNLPKERPITYREMPAFREHALTLLAQLKLFEEHYLALKNQKRALSSSALG